MKKTNLFTSSFQLVSLPVMSVLGPLRSFFVYELKRRLRTWDIIIYVATVVILVFIANQGKNKSPDLLSGYMSFSWILLHLGVFLGLIYGYDTTRSRGYLKFLSSVQGAGKIFFLAIISRMVLLNLAFLGWVGVCYLWFFIHNIHLFQPIIPVIGMVLAVNTFFFAVGCITGSLQFQFPRSMVLAVVLFLSILIVPWLAEEPANSRPGVPITLSCIGIAFAIAYFFYKKQLFPLAERGSTDAVALALNKGDDVYIHTAHQQPVADLYNILSGRITGFTGKIHIDGKSIVTGEKKEFVYSCSLDEIPGDIPVNALLKLLKGLANSSGEGAQEFRAALEKEFPGIGRKRFHRLKLEEKAGVLVKAVQLTGREVCVFHDVGGSFTARFRELKRGSGLVVYFAAPGSSLLGVKRHLVVFKKENRYWYKELPLTT